MGLGPSAHSYNGISRKWNVANNALYIQTLRNNMLPSEMEKLTSVQKLNEYVMTSLRTLEGLDLTRVVQEFGKNEVERIQTSIEKHVTSGLVTQNGNLFQLTRHGKLYADGIASDLFE